MQFRGQLKLPGQSTSGVSVDLRVDDIFLELHSNGEMLGRWRLDDVSVERVVSNEFNLIFDDERLLFLADDALAFAYEGLTTIEQVSAKLRKKRRRSRGAGDSMRGLLRRLGADRSDGAQAPTAPPQESAEEPGEEPALTGPPPPAPPPLAFLDAIGRSAASVGESGAAAISELEEPTADDGAPAEAVAPEPAATPPASPVVVWDVEVPAVSYAVDFEAVTRRRSSRTQPPPAAGSDDGHGVAHPTEGVVEDSSPEPPPPADHPATMEAPAAEPAATHPQPEEHLPTEEPGAEATAPEGEGVPGPVQEEDLAQEAAPDSDIPTPAELPRRTVAPSTPAPLPPAPSRTRTPSDEPPCRGTRTSDVPVVPAATAPVPEIEEPQPPWVIPEVSEEATLPLPPEPEVFVEVEPPAATAGQETEDPLGEEHPRRHLSLVRWEDADEPEAESGGEHPAPSAPTTAHHAAPPVPAPAPAPVAGEEHREAVDGNGRRKGGLLGGLFGRSKPEQHSHQFRESRTVGGIIRRVCTVCGHVSFDGEDIYADT